MLPILALDVSGKCTGWAFGLPSDIPLSGTVSWLKDGGDHDDAFRDGLRWLSDFIEARRPKIVAIEAPIKSSGFGHTNADSQAMLLGLQGALRATVRAMLPNKAVLVPSQTARVTFCGRGTFPKGTAKDAVQAEVLRRGFLDIADLQEDRCDAICLWTHMAFQQNPELKHPSSRKGR